MSFFESLFGKLFGNKEKQERRHSSAPSPSAPIKPRRLAATSEPPRKEEMIRVFDSYGRELFLTRQQWRDSVLLGNIKNAWNKPDDLYQLILSALQDGFRSDIIKAAEHLYKIDPQPDRAACIWGIVLLEENRLKEAEEVFRRHIAQHGEKGFILTNLAKVYAKRNDNAKAEEILWHGLEIDPNQDNGMLWYEVLHRERGGEEAGLDALRRVAAIPSSWRAQLWLARAALKSNQLEKAITYYQESLRCAGTPVPTDLLMQMSGDLGNYAHLPELLNLTEPYFDVAVHGIQVGNNLIKAHLDLGQIDEARRILELLYALKRPDWKQTLNFWDTEIAKTRVSTSPAAKPGDLKMALLSIEGAIWLPEASAAAELFPAKATSAPVVCFLGSSAEVASTSELVQHQLSDGPGRMSRALPLFLAEQVESGSQAHARTLVPWIVGESSGFVLSGVPFTDEAAAEYARREQIKGDYVVITHLRTKAEPWIADLRLVRTIDAKCVGTLKASFAPQTPGTVFRKIATELMTLLAKEAEIVHENAPALYHVPDEANFPHYLLRLEQLLAIRCSACEESAHAKLSGERETIDGNFQLSVACPTNVTTRILLAQTLLSMKKVRPEILTEFSDKAALLQSQYPLSEPAHGVIQRMLNDAFKA